MAAGVPKGDEKVDEGVVAGAPKGDDVGAVVPNPPVVPKANLVYCQRGRIRRL